MNVSMIFGIIFTIIVIALLLVFGSSQIRDLFCLSNDAIVVKAIKDLGTRVEELYLQAEGSSETFTLNIPDAYKICFINTDNPSFNSLGIDPVHKITIQSPDNKFNIWSFQCSGKYDSGQRGYRIKNLIIPDDNQFCVKSGAKLYLENKGDYVSIEKL